MENIRLNSSDSVSSQELRLPVTSSSIFLFFLYNQITGKIFHVRSLLRSLITQGGLFHSGPRLQHVPVPDAQINVFRVLL